MPKRSAEEKIERYNKKIRKLQRKAEKRQDRIIFSDDDVDNIQESTTKTGDDTNTDSLTNGVIDESPLLPVEVQNQPEIEVPAIQNVSPTPLDESAEINPTASTSSSRLDPDLLSALGASTSDAPEFGEPIHESLANLWSPLLKKGLTKEDRDRMFKETLVPDNCKMLQAPKLNAEISAAVVEMVRNRDKKVQTMQQQLGIGIAAVNRGMHVLLTSDNKINALKSLSDGSRILCDLHSSLTKDRIKLITPNLDKNFTHMIKDCERDESLFGASLSEKIKASKAIEKQGSQIRKTAPKSVPQSTTANRPANQGNWTGPPRYPSNRGGARGIQTTSTSAAGTSSPTVQHFDAAVDVDTASQEQPVEDDSCPTALTTQGAAPVACDAYPGCREALRRAFANRGSPSEAFPLMIASLADTTLNQYNVTYKLWWEFCTTSNINIYSQAVTPILSFLSQQFNRGCSYGTLNNHRSALSLLLGSKLVSVDSVKRLLRGAYRLKPAIPKYHSTWDPQVVLNLVSTWYPNLELGLEKITKKLIALLALCTAHRMQTFSLIKIKDISFNDSGVQIGITQAIKTSAIGREQPVLFLPFFEQNTSICPASLLKDYLAFTAKIREDKSGTLFLTYKSPYKAATSQTLSRWIKSVLRESGVDTSVFSAHSTRHASTSAAHAAGVSLDTIRATAGWTSRSQTFARFYNRPIIAKDDFANVILNGD